MQGSDYHERTNGIATNLDRTSTTILVTLQDIHDLPICTHCFLSTFPSPLPGFLLRYASRLQSSRPFDTTLIRTFPINKYRVYFAEQRTAVGHSRMAKPNSHARHPVSIIFTTRLSLYRIPKPTANLVFVHSQLIANFFPSFPGLEHRHHRISYGTVASGAEETTCMPNTSEMPHELA